MAAALAAVRAATAARAPLGLDAFLSAADVGDGSRAHDKSGTDADGALDTNGVGDAANADGTDGTRDPDSRLGRGGQATPPKPPGVVLARRVIDSVPDALASAAANVRTSALTLLATALTIMGASDREGLLPLLHKLWPNLVSTLGTAGAGWRGESVAYAPVLTLRLVAGRPFHQQLLRLKDDDPDVQGAAVELFAVAAATSGDFLARRTREQLWPQLEMMLTEAANTASSASGQTRCSIGTKAAPSRGDCSG